MWRDVQVQILSFFVRIHSYPKRSKMDRPSIPGELKYLLNPVTKSVLRKPDDPFLDDIAFTKSKDETKQVAFMAKELSKGDPAATSHNKCPSQVLYHHQKRGVIQSQI